MNKKGFTLVELLGVIVILGVIASLTVPTITGIIKNNKEKTYNAQVNTIIDAAKNWSINNTDYLSETNDLYVDISAFSRLGYLENDSLIDPRDNSAITGCVKISYASNYSQYEYDFSKEYTNCTNLYTIYEVVINKFPYLEIGTDGCKTNTSGTNYTYMRGCYLAGVTTDNYIWYSGFVWRIMGINADKSVRMITEEYPTVISYNVANITTFNGSRAEDWLNNYFYSHLKNTSIITNGNWCERGTNYVTDSATANSTTCVGTVINDENSKIGLISLDEYNLASAKSSYLVNSLSFWTLTPHSSSSAWFVRDDGYASNYYVNFTIGLRPVINVNSTTTITSGNGTLSDNYILGETKETNITGNLKDIATSGEYVTLAGKTYRVVSIDSNGNTKLILDGYYQETAGTNYTMLYGSTSTFDTTTTTGVGYKLNNDVLNYLISSSDTTNRNKLVTYNWYQNNFDYGNSYTVSLNETSPTRTISATVGLIRVGEMLSSQSLTILNKNNTVTNSYSNAAYYWAMTPNRISSAGWDVSYCGKANSNDVGITYGLRPVIVVNSSVTITSGNGTPQSPYQI